MRGPFAHSLQKLRGAIVIAGSMALILQPPARCWSCSLGLPNRVQSSAHQQQPGQPTLHSCCKNSAAARPTSIAAGNCTVLINASTCGCKFQLPQRIYVSTDRLTTPSDSMATLPNVQPLIVAGSGNAEWVAASFCDLPPPVPHRILHCSWII